MSDTIAVLLAISLPLLLFGLAFVVGCFETRAVNQFESAQLYVGPSFNRNLARSLRSLASEMAGG